MRTLNLFNGYECIGSIYDVPEKGLIVKLKYVYGTMWVKKPKSIDLTSLERFININEGVIIGKKTIEFAVELDTVPDETYKIRIRNRCLYLIDKSDAEIYTDSCTEARIKSESERKNIYAEKI